ncbi:MAG: hypothetical protein AABX29_07505 [Nanoarchaeota archaeon]
MKKEELRKKVGLTKKEWKKFMVEKGKSWSEYETKRELEIKL